MGLPSHDIRELIKQYRVEFAKEIQNHLLKLAPKALALKDAIISDDEHSIWLRDRVASDILDRILPKPSQQINIKGALVTAQYTDEELKAILLSRLMVAAEAEDPDG